MSSLDSGARTIVEQCLNIQKDESVLVLNDGNDADLINTLTRFLQQNDYDYTLKEYPEPENHGEEPPQEIAEAMKNYDVVIAPTLKSLSHTEARIKACESGSRVATLPTITKEIWNTSLQADYKEVERITKKAYELLEDTSEVRIKTPSGTDLTLEVNIEFFHKDTGIIQEPGDFGNLPAGEADGGVVDANGMLVTDHFPFAPAGTKVEIKDAEAVSVEHVDEEVSELAEAFEEYEGAKNVAEFGFGTNPKATLIGNVLQDEKVLGTIHVAFGDNSSYIPEEHERRQSCEIHWDTICESPTVWFDDQKVLDQGKPVFLD
ncbi:MAG: leucyl aminopeptidase (aminopeptidase T) [Candidatus Nanohaloarchaea archaeon]|jgi:leucyl aminopeptidase (aminopeptidase T)